MTQTPHADSSSHAQHDATNGGASTGDKDASAPSTAAHVTTTETVEQADPYALQRGSASTTVEKITLKRGDAFLVADSRGDLPESEEETGLYWRGTRFLRSCDVFLAGQPLITLSHSISDEEGACRIDLTNPYLHLGQETVFQGELHVRRQLQLDEQRLSETLTLTNFHTTPLAFRLGLRLDADFRDIFEVRGMRRPARGTLLPPELSPQGVRIAYEGLDGVRRSTECDVAPAASHANAQGVFWDVTLAPSAELDIHVTALFGEGEALGQVEQQFSASGVIRRDQLPRGSNLPVVRGDNVFFNRMLDRGMHDLEMMCANTSEGLYPYGGIPWYVCPFGRDALITSLEFLPWYPEVARGTLGFLAKYQGTKLDPFTDEEPGKILHEFRQGEMANLREIPFIPYYGTIDATPLFLVLLESYIRWSDDLAFLRRLWPHALAAARWMEEYGDVDGDTFLEYQRSTETGLVNQGWKDSWDSVSHADGRLAPGPIALCEVQGYAYMAYRAMAYLARRLDHPEADATRWEGRADELRANVLSRFWWPEEDVLYLALDGEKQPCAVVNSNAGQALWTGILPEDWAEATVSRLMRPDMYTGWGIRTLSAQTARYNPMSYHNGSVWPHDTAIVGAGFARYGRKHEAGELLGHLYGLSLYYAGARLPELFCGFERQLGYGPTRYPVACSPQSWAAGAPFLLLGALLGFEPDAGQQRLTLRRPTLPRWMHSLELTRLRLGQQELTVRFEQAAHGASVILEGDSEIEVRVLPR